MWNFDLFKEMQRIQNEIDKMFTNNFKDTEHPMIESKTLTPNNKPARMPACDFKETKDAFLLNFEIPGAKPENINLDVTNNAIQLEVEQKDKQEVKDEKQYSFSAYKNRFYRRIPLDTEIDTEKVMAKYENGILNVTAPKLHPNNDHKKISIQ